MKSKEESRTDSDPPAVAMEPRHPEVTVPEIPISVSAASSADCIAMWTPAEKIGSTKVTASPMATNRCAPTAGVVRYEKFATVQTCGPGSPRTAAATLGHAATIAS